VVAGSRWKLWGRIASHSRELGGICRRPGATLGPFGPLIRTCLLRGDGLLISWARACFVALRNRPGKAA
jgi:hypothetical protein